MISLLLLLATVLMIYRSYPGETWTRDGAHRMRFELSRDRFLVEVIARTGTQLSAVLLSPIPAVPLGRTPSVNENVANFAAPVLWKHRPRAEPLWGPLTPVSTFGRTAITEWSIHTVGGGQTFRVDRFTIWAYPLWVPCIFFVVLPAVWMYRRARTWSRRIVPGFPVIAESQNVV